MKLSGPRLSVIKNWSVHFYSSNIACLRLQNNVQLFPVAKNRVYLLSYLVTLTSPQSNLFRAKLEVTLVIGVFYSGVRLQK